MLPEFESIFVRLRTILQNHAGGFSVTDNTPDRYCLEGVPGPATLRAWAGTMKKRLIPVAWVEIGKSYVSFHVMALDNSKLREGMSNELRARMHGKTCFNFKTRDEGLFKELEQLTARGLAGFKEAGFVSEEKSPSAVRDVPARH